MRRRIVTFAAVVICTAVGLASPAHAHIQSLTIDSQAFVSPDGNTVEVTGSLTCTLGERYRLRVDVTQGTSKAQGFDRGDCTGAAQSFTVHAIRYTQPPFSPNGGTGCVRAQTGVEGGTGPHATSAQVCTTLTMDTI